jgi:uncharacterized protein YhhL (DUF1145 family)
MLISFIITLIIVGVVLYLVNTLLPIDARIKTVINVVVLICVLLYTLQFFGITGDMGLSHHWR